MNLSGKKIVLTGASSGIGLELLKLLAKYDATIIAVGRNIENIPIINNRVIPYKCDVSQNTNIDNLFDFALKSMGKIDLFIANAGFAYCEELNKADWDHAESIFRTNVISPIYSFEKMKELNKDRKYTVVMTCSAVSNVPLPGYALYCSTKAAIAQFAHTYRFERNDKGTLTLVYPVASASNFFKNAGNKAPAPFPVHPPKWVALCILTGIRFNFSSVYPSLLYLLSYYTINRVFPFIYGIYDMVNAIRFKHWVKKQ